MGMSVEECQNRIVAVGVGVWTLLKDFGGQRMFESRRNLMWLLGNNREPGFVREC